MTIAGRPGECDAMLRRQGMIDFDEAEIFSGRIPGCKDVLACIAVGTLGVAPPGKSIYPDFPGSFLR